MKYLIWALALTLTLIGIESGADEETVCIDSYWDEDTGTERCVRWWVIDHPNCIWEIKEACMTADGQIETK